MNEPPGNRLRVALTGLTMAEKFRDEGRDVLLFVDNIYRYTLEHGSIRTAGPYALAVGPQPTLAKRWGSAGTYHLHQNWFYHLRTGSIRTCE